MREQYPRGASFDVLLRLLPEHSLIGIRRKAESLGLRRDPELLLSGRVGYFDIESTGLKGNFDAMLCWFIKERRRDRYDFDCVEPEDFRARDKTRMDARVVSTLAAALERYDVLVSYYGSGFDFPFSRTRALKCGVPFPPYGSSRHVDLYYSARGRLSLHSKRLEVVSRFLGIPGKTPLDPDVWVGARLGDARCLRYVRDHCRADVEVLEKVHERLSAFISTPRTSI